MKPIIIFILLFGTATCLAQKKQNVYFLKNNGRYVDTKDSADIIRVVSEPDSGTQLYNVAEFYKTDKRKLVAKSSTIDPPKFEGIVVTNYESGLRRAVNNYNNNVLAGDQYYFFPNGKPYVVHTGKVFPPNNVAEFTITANYDSLGTALVTNGNGHFIGYDDSFKKVTEEGPVKDGQKDGEWKYQDSLATRIETFDKGKFITGTSIGKDGETTTYTIREILPSFPGGVNAFSQYLAKTLRYPRVDRDNSIQGKVLLTFVVEKDGKIANIKVLRSVSPTIDAEAVRVVEQSPLWKPGYQYGKLVRAQYTLPLSFNLGSPPR